MLAVLVLAAAAAATEAGPTTREMERINWMEFREWVPSRIERLPRHQRVLAFRHRRRARVIGEAAHDGLADVYCHTFREGTWRRDPGRRRS
jgi:hypothetical protein